MRCVLPGLAMLFTLTAHGVDLPGDVLYGAPAGYRYVEINGDGETVLPNGRLITPRGDLYRVRPHPYGLTRSPDGRWVVTVSSEGPQLSILDLSDPGNPRLSFIPDM